METKGARLASRLNSAIDDMVNDTTSRSDIVSRMASEAGISSGTVNEILNESINCPPLNRLEGFAEALNISLRTIRSAAESDGCEYGDDGKAKLCVLIPKYKTDKEYRAFAAGRLHKLNNDRAKKRFDI